MPGCPRNEDRGSVTVPTSRTRRRTQLVALTMASCFVTQIGFAQSEPSDAPSPVSPAAPSSEPRSGTEEREEQAQALFQRGLALAAEERWPEAERLFAQSFDLVRRPSTAFNWALALYRLGRMLDVVTAVDHFVKLSDPVKDDAQRDAARQLQARARAALAMLVVRIEPEDARLDIDGVARPETGASRQLTLDPREHVLLVTRPGYRPERRQLSLSAAERSTLVVALQPIVVQQAPAHPPPAKRLPADATSRGPGVLPWIVLGAGGLTLTAAAVTGILVLQKDSALDRRCNEPEGKCPASEKDSIDDEQRELDALITTTDVLWVTGSVLAITGVGWLWLASDRAPAQVSASATTKGVYLGVRGRL